MFWKPKLIFSDLETEKNKVEACLHWWIRRLRCCCQTRSPNSHSGCCQSIWWPLLLRNEGGSLHLWRLAYSRPKSSVFGFFENISCFLETFLYLPKRIFFYGPYRQYFFKCGTPWKHLQFTFSKTLFKTQKMLFKNFTEQLVSWSLSSLLMFIIKSLELQVIIF